MIKLIYYFIGIKGSGMSALAQIMSDLGYTVMGSDKPDHFFTEAGLIKKNSLVKILGNGTLTIKLEVKAHAFSKTAITAIESVQGTVVKL